MKKQKLDENSRIWDTLAKNRAERFLEEKHPEASAEAKEKLAKILVQFNKWQIEKNLIIY